MYRPAPSVPAYRGENCGGHHRRRPEIRPQQLDGAGLRLHHSEESTHSPQRILPLLDRGRFHPEEPHAERAHDETGQLSSSPGQGVLTRARAGNHLYSHGNRQV